MTILAIMAFLLIKHFAFDFPFQTQNMLSQKGNYLAGGGIHHAVFHGCGTAFVFMCFGYTEIATTLGVIDALVHYHIDFAKAKTNKWASLQSNNPMFWNAIGLDQLAHSLTYVFLIYLTLI